MLRRPLSGRALPALVTALALAACTDPSSPTAPAAAAPRAAAASSVPVIVTLAPDRAAGPAANAARARAAARALGVTPRRLYGTALVGFAARVPAAALAGLRRAPGVVAVELDRVDRGPDASLAGKTKPVPAPTSTQVTPWGVTRIGASGLAYTAAGQHVYIIDSGIDSDHPEFAGLLGVGTAFVPCTTAGAAAGTQCAQPWDDDNGHGTHVAGVVGAANNLAGVVGVAPGVTLHAVKVLAQDGLGYRSDIIAGIDWVAQQVRASGKPAVANVSIHGTGTKTGTCSDTGFVGADAYHQAICTAMQAGVVFAVAAGNDGADAANTVPAAYDDAVLAVSATQAPDNFPVWSNFGGALAPWTTTASAPIALAAPGADVLSTWVGGGTATVSGTSQAAPHVAGSLALFLTRTPQPGSAAAFQAARAKLLATAQSTATWTNTSGRPHAEPLVRAAGF